MDYLLVVICYLLGSISFGYLLGKLLRKVDIRQYGSGSSGATNTLRVLGPWIGGTVFVLDVLKGAVSVWLAKNFGTATWIIPACAISVVAGHNWPLYFKFKGGRGAATTLGVVFAISFWITIVGFAVIVLIIALTRYVSLASILGGLALPIVFLVFDFGTEYIIMGIILGILLLLRHTSNIKRLINGTESKIGQKIDISKKNK
ncbi:MAG: glycerol-3-phosphate 1-O-acyltransferase PlsY [Dethiobacteria bacterium]|jgi:glycerol-3-phosphate acyltransferase PlsY